jgi:hypothetical protein
VKAPTPIKIPTRRETDPECGRLSDLIEKLRAEQRIMRTEAREVDARIRANRSIAPTSNVARSARAATLIGEAPHQVPSADIDRLREISGGIEDRDAAIELLTNKLELANRRASQVIVNKISGTHKQLVADICAALITARQAAWAYGQLVDRLSADSVAWTSMIPMQPHQVMGHPSDKYGPVALYLREAVAAGFIDAAIVPVELRT